MSIIQGILPLQLFLFRSLLILVIVDALSFRVPLPGGRSISMSDNGVLRINLASDSNGPKVIVPPLGTVASVDIFNSIVVRDTKTKKGFGAFSTSELPSDAFLGFYEGEVITTREKLDSIISERKSTGDNIQNAMDYVMSLDGGLTFVDGFAR